MGRVVTGLRAKTVRRSKNRRAMSLLRDRFAVRNFSTREARAF